MRFIAVMSVIVLLGALPAQAEDCSTTVDLVAGQFIDAGDVHISRTGSTLCVEYEAAAPWTLVETHVHVAAELSGIPQTKSGNPKIGRFDFSTEHAAGVSAYKYVIDLAKLGLADASSLCVAAHAVVKNAVTRQTETGWARGEGFPGKSWAMYVQIICEKTTRRLTNSFVGYEDRRGGDFDYNDWGMSMSVVEVFGPDNCLESITMRFEAVTHIAGDSHDIHILRTLSNATTYNYTISRNRAAAGTETANGPGSGAGDFDVVLFDSDAFAAGDWVEVELTVINCDDPLVALTAPRFDLDPLFSLYDPYMYDRTIDTERHILDVQPYLGTGTFDVPYLLVVPLIPWPAPGEGVLVTSLYPDFDDWYSTQNPAFADWYLP